MRSPTQSASPTLSRLLSVTLNGHTQNGQALLSSGIHTSKIVVRALCQKFSDDGFHFSPMGSGLDGEHLWVVPDRNKTSICTLLQLEEMFGRSIAPLSRLCRDPRYGTGHASRGGNHGPVRGHQSQYSYCFTESCRALALAYGVLPPLPSLVVGRERVLQDLKERAGIGGELRPATVVQGWPGVGKSTIVAALAHDPDIAQAFPDGVLWTSLGEAPNLLADLLVWAEALHLTSPGQVAQLETITAQLNAVLRDRRMLLIIDDLWQVEHAAPFKVGGHSCALVMTSRLNDVAQALAPTSYDLYRLPVLADESALELLGILSPETVASYPVEARELVRDLEGLPLAIQVAGRLLQNEARLGWGVGELLAALRQGAALLTAQVPSDMVGAGRDTTPTFSALLKRSTDALDLETREHFAYLGLFAPKPATFFFCEHVVVGDSIRDKRYRIATETQQHQPVPPNGELRRGASVFPVVCIA